MAKNIQEIMKGRKKFKLGELTDITSSKRIFFSEYLSDGVPFYRSKEIIEKFNNQNVSTELFIGKERFNKIKQQYGVPKRGDILLTSVGTLGVPWLIEDDSEFYFKDGNLTWFRSFKKEALWNKYLYYWFISRQGKQALLESSIGSTQQALTIAGLKNIEIELPTLGEQYTIAKIIGDLDEKIRLNYKMNKTLESIAQAIFKRWFVNFEFPDKNDNSYKSSGGKMIDSEFGEIPEGWKVKPLDQVAEFLNGLALQKFPQTDDRYLPAIKIRELNQGVTESSDKVSSDIDHEYVVDDGDILFSWSGSLQICIWCHGKGALNQHLFKVTSLNYPKLFFFSWTSFYLPEFRQIAEGKVTTMGHIQRKHLSAALVTVPPEKTLETMTRTMSPIIDQIIVNSVEVRKLSKIRDSLLPKLMSGQVRIRQS